MHIVGSLKRSRTHMRGIMMIIAEHFRESVDHFKIWNCPVTNGIHSSLLYRHIHAETYSSVNCRIWIYAKAVQRMRNREKEKA